jgi:hypothetical protein
MPNHVHVLLLPKMSLPVIMRWLKGSTARQANLILGRTGEAFWQDESFDHRVRDEAELDRLVQLCGVQPGKRRPGSQSACLALVEHGVGRRKRLPHDWSESLPKCRYASGRRKRLPHDWPESLPKCRYASGRRKRLPHNWPDRSRNVDTPMAGESACPTIGPIAPEM